VTPARHGLDDLMLEADALVGEVPLDSTRAELFEGRAVSVLVSPSAGAHAGRSDISITMVPKAGAWGPLDCVVATLVGDGGRRRLRLDARGRCLMRDVPDGRYRLGFCRAPAPGYLDSGAGSP
jgi:hypothetical protein